MTGTPLMRKATALLLALSLSSALWAQADRAKLMKINNFYRQAMELFKAKEYLKAIKIWENVLAIDPKQKIPKKMIDSARELVKESINPVLEEAALLLKSGEYMKAYEKYMYLLSLDSTNPKAKSAVAKIETVTKYWKEVDDLEPHSKLLVRSLEEFIDPAGDLRHAIIGIIYLSQTVPDDGKISEFHEYLKMNFQDMYLSEKPVPGINILEQKLNGARYNIEDGKFDLSIKNCNDALFLDDNNIVAMARLGTSYYLLGKLSKAKEIWKKAISIDPNHESSKTIREFLSKIK